MSKDKIKLEVTQRDLHKKDFIPAVLYGPQRENVHLSVDYKKITKLYHEIGESSLLELELDGKKLSSALIYEIQRNPLNGSITHVDFFEPNLKEKVDAEVAVVYVGESNGVKDSRGTLVKNFDTLLVRALPEELPHEISVDISMIKNADDVIYVKDIDLPIGVDILQEEDAVIAMVSRTENVDEQLEKPVDEGEDPEVINDKNKEENEKE